MIPLTAEDIARMKASGHPAEEIRSAEAKLTVADQIRTAFRGIKLGEGIGLLEANGLDDYEDAETLAKFRREDEKESWEAIPFHRLRECHSSLSFFDAEGMRFHLPAFMIAELWGEWGFGLDITLTFPAAERYEPTSAVPTEMELAMNDPERIAIINEHRKSRFAILNSAQRHAVRALLVHMIDDPEYSYSREEIQEALQRYWAGDLPPS